VAVGLPGGPGAAVGKIVFDAKTAEERKANNDNVILVRENTSPEDVGGMWAAVGVLTARGGMTSHAAVVARGWGKPCICGCGELEIDEHAKTMTVQSTGEVFKEGDVISLNGSTGEVIRIPIETSTAAVGGDLGIVLGWADAVEDVCGVMTNADSSIDAAKAAEFGAKGIGLCRTEHMFFSPDRLPVVRRWILRGEGLDKVQEFQRSDFYNIFDVMNGKPVTIRMLDPPLHEFLPKLSQVDEGLAMQLGFGTDVKELTEKVESLHEENPMLGTKQWQVVSW
jgi:pyruvate, orthophosphate dikinase